MNMNSELWSVSRTDMPSYKGRSMKKNLGGFRCRVVQVCIGDKDLCNWVVFVEIVGFEVPPNPHFRSNGDPMCSSCVEIKNIGFHRTSI